VLLQSEITPARPRQLVIAEDAFEMADPAIADALEPTLPIFTHRKENRKRCLSRGPYD
jgi:hypothetical protein